MAVGEQGAAAPSLARAQHYCRRLARRHYENFTVASRLLPRPLREHLYPVYAYCRWADDLADTGGDASIRLVQLDWWENQLRACYEGRAQHPVFVALAETVGALQIPMQPFLDLLVAFRQDQRRQRYESIDELLGYCRYSANPVGRIVLYLGHCHDPENAQLSDAICTGLQLANFWQDLARDADQGRIYLPRQVCHAHHYSEAMLGRREANAAFRSMMRSEVERAETYLLRGLPLAQRVPSEMRMQVALFAYGGLEVLQRIRRIGYNVWAQRPAVGRAAKLRLLFRALWHFGWPRSLRSMP